MIRIVYGYTMRHSPVGQVAMFCPLCRDLTPMRIDDCKRVFHVYWIPFGGGEHAEYRAVCTHCGYATEPPDPLAEAAVPARATFSTEAMLDLVQATQPDLLKRADPRLVAEAKIRRGDQLSDKERAGYLLEPFSAAAGLLRGTGLGDMVRILGKRNALLMCLAVTVAIVSAVVFCMIIPLTLWLDIAHHPGDAHTGQKVWSVISLITGAVLLGLCFWRIKQMDSQASARLRILRALEPLQPTEEECTALIEAAKEQKWTTAKLFTAKSLWAQLEAADAAARAGIAADAEPFTEHFAAVLKQTGAVPRQAPPAPAPTRKPQPQPQATPQAKPQARQAAMPTAKPRAKPAASLQAKRPPNPPKR